MSKDNRTINDLTDNIQQDYSWRIKELSDYNIILHSSNSNTQKTLIRGGIVLLYAHWEGFVKYSTKQYYNYVVLKKKNMKDLNLCFQAICVRKYIHSLLESNKIVIQNDSVKYFHSNLDKRAKLPSEIPIRTSNLSFEKFIDYCIILGIDKNQFALDKLFINVKLLSNRHRIAHGKYLFININNFNQIYKKTIDLLYKVKNEIINSAQLNKYRNKV